MRYMTKKIISLLDEGKIEEAKELLKECELSITRERRQGTFETLRVRRGLKKRQRTEKSREHKKNPRKVVLCKMGDLEIYVLPFDFPDKVFLGKYPVNVELDEFTFNFLFKAYNRIRWFLRGEWQKEEKRIHKIPKKQVGLWILREKIKKAYNYALNEERMKEKEAIDKRVHNSPKTFKKKPKFRLSEIGKPQNKTEIEKGESARRETQKITENLTLNKERGEKWKGNITSKYI